jgi:hypothetical protein
LLNSIIGLAIWLLLAICLVPPYGATGMAISVSIAVVVTAWAAVIELMVSDKLSPFGSGFWRAAAVGAGVLVALWLLGEALAPFGAPVRAIGLLLIFWPLLWLGLVYGLPTEDKAALGKFGKRLRLGSGA